MEHDFDLPVLYRNEEMSFKSRMVSFGYGYKFYIEVAGQEIVFEKDDDMQYRAIDYNPDVHKKINIEHLEAIVAALQQLG